MFRQFDPNGNGQLSLAEIDKGIQDVLECATLFDAKPAIIRAFQAAKNAVQSKSEVGADFIEFPEFRIFLCKLRQQFEYWEMFLRLDTTGDRRIGLEEFKEAIPKLNEWGIKITNAQSAFNEIDTNGGGHVLFDEFVDWALEKNLDLEDDEDLYGFDSNYINSSSLKNK